LEAAWRVSGVIRDGHLRKGEREIRKSVINVGGEKEKWPSGRSVSEESDQKDGDIFRLQNISRLIPLRKKKERGGRADPVRG